MTRTLTGTLTAGESVDTDVAELELAQAQAAVAEAEAAAARARAEVARARARAARGRGPEPAAAEVVPDVEAKESGAESDTSIDSAGVAEPEPEPVAESVGSGPDAAPEVRESGRLRPILGGVLRRPTRRGIALTVILLISAAALAGAAGIGWQHHQAGEDTARTRTFVDAAELGVVAITSLDYRNVERDVKRIVERSTGEFAKDFTDRSKDFTSVIQKSQVTTKGKVTGAALESIQGDTATVLVAATSEVTNAAGAKQEPRTWRLRVSVTDVNGTVKVSKVDFVP